MTVTATSAIFSIAPQATKISDGTFTVASYTWYKFATMDADFGVRQRQEMMPMELRGALTPSGAYKALSWCAGGANMLPRLEDDLGWLLYAACGDVSTLTDEPVAGAYTHIFRFNPSDHTDIPWLAARKWIPGATASDALGEYGYDCRVAGLQITLPQGGLIRSRVDLQGRIGKWEEAPSWTYTNEYESFGSVPIATKGAGVEIEGDSDSKFTNAQITLINDLTTPQEESVLGSYYPDDVAVRQRRVEIAFTYKWADPNLYQELLAGGATGVDWSPVVYSALTAGSVPGLKIAAQSPEVITGTTPYEIQILGNNVVFQTAGAPRLAPGGMLMLPVTATLVQPTSGDYVEIRLINGTASYTWPT